MDVPRANRQLQLIAEALELARANGITVWLRGGWAMDFYLGEYTRDHVDIDWLVWATDAAALDDVLVRHGYEPVVGPPPEQQRDYLKDGFDLSFALLAQDASGRPVCRAARSPVPRGPRPRRRRIRAASTGWSARSWVPATR